MLDSFSHSLSRTIIIWVLVFIVTLVDGLGMPLLPKVLKMRSRDCKGTFFHTASSCIIKSFQVPLYQTACTFAGGAPGDKGDFVQSGKILRGF
jgi:hypothetical protein